MNIKSIAIATTLAADVSVYHYRVTFKPEAIIPDIRVEGGKQ